VKMDDFLLSIGMNEKLLIIMVGDNYVI